MAPNSAEDALSPHPPPTPHSVVPSPGRESVSSLKRDASVALADDHGIPAADGSDGGGGSRKKKKMGPGSRGVANLTPEQLAKKRANDREAQRAIRERTKRQIETLEQRIEELTNQQPYQELQAVLRAKEAVEQENADIKRRLASIVGMLQPIIGQNAVEQAYASPAQTYVPPIQNPSSIGLQAGTNNPSTPGSASSPSSFDHTSHVQHAQPPSQQARQQAHPQSAAPQQQPQQRHQQWQAANSHAPTSDQTKMQLSQQQHDLRHGLDLGPERLGLDFLLDPSQRANRIQNGANGAQDSPQYQHVPMKHDWTGVASNRTLHTRQRSWESPRQIPAPSSDGSSSTPREQISAARYSAPIRNCSPTCPLDSLLLDFLSERRQRAAEGLPVQEVIGPRYPSVSSLLNPSNSAYSHPLSKVFTDILSTFPDISTLPERVAVLYIMFLLMRWQIEPTRENYERLPEWMVPLSAQIYVPHPAWIDHIPFPLMREKLVHESKGTTYQFDNFFVPFTTTLTLSWPYEETDTLLQSPDGDELMINPVFERHMRNLDNWKLGDAFAKALPGLADRCNLIEKRPVQGQRSMSSSSSNGR